MKKQDDIATKKSIAIWLGDLTDSDALDDYLNLGRQFESDFGFTINDRAAPEVSTPDGRVHDVSALLDGFSFCEDWLDDAVRLCREAGKTTARVAVVFYHLRYPSELCNNSSAPLRFICNVPWNIKQE